MDDRTLDRLDSAGAGLVIVGAVVCMVLFLVLVWMVTGDVWLSAR